MQLLIIISFFFVVNGHMGISGISPAGTQPLKPRDFKVGDSYRNPNSGHCHGVPAGSPYAGKTFTSGETLTFTLSGGAAHGGGQCALFLADPNQSEETWYKQMDVIDCSLMTSFTWKIESGNVPAFCGAAGCTLLWLWSPMFSGTCEIYINCFDIKITGGNADLTKLITVSKTSIASKCTRPNTQTKITPNYGTFCGPDNLAAFKTSYPCPAAAAGPTPAPASPTPAAAGPSPTPAAAGPTPAPASPTPAPPTGIPFRCGEGWVDANNKCLKACTVENEGTQCVGTEKCFADMTRSCEKTTNTNKLTCKAIGAWAAYPGMDSWCQKNAAGNTGDFSSHCDCNIGSGSAGYGDTNIDFVPDCQKVIANGTKTFESISHDYDLASYQLESDFTAASKKAAESLLTYNSQCNNALMSLTVTSPIPEGTTVYITGDCQMTKACMKSDMKSGVMRMAPSSILMTIVILFAWGM